MNIFFKIAVWVEERRSIKKLEFNERLRPLEVSIQAQNRVIKTIMDRLVDEKPLRQEIKALRDKIGQ